MIRRLASYSMVMSSDERLRRDAGSTRSRKYTESTLFFTSVKVVSFIFVLRLFKISIKAGTTRGNSKRCIIISIINSN